MNKEALANELNLLLGTEAVSLARHIVSIRPYLSRRTYRTWQELSELHLDVANQRHISRLLSLLERVNHGLPVPPFQTDVARFHYVDVQTLLPRLIEEKRQQVAAYRRAIDHTGNDAAIRGELAQLLGENEEQLRQLEGLPQAQEPAPPQAAPGPN